ADAALEKDTMRFIVVAAALVDLLVPIWQAHADKRADADKASAWGRELKSTLRLLGGTLTYAATFAKPKDPSNPPSEKDLHEQRTKILESMTEDMSDRTGREGAWILSLGGALRVMGGARFGVKTRAHAMQGPLSLPLG